MLSKTNCVNCGAPITNNEQCEYCGTLVSKKAGKFVEDSLQDKQCASVEEATALLSTPCYVR